MCHEHRKRKPTSLCLLIYPWPFQSSSHKAKAARMQSWRVFCHRGCLQPALTLHYRSIHSLFLIEFSLPSFTAEWAQLHLRSHRELETAAGPCSGLNWVQWCFLVACREWLQQRSFHCHGGAGTGLHWIPGVHPWEGMDDLVGSCPAFNASPRGWVSLLVWGLCSGSHPSNKGTAVLLTQLQLQGSEYREQACRNTRPSAHVAA